MPVFEEFPYTNFHELNLDWIIKEIKELRSDLADIASGHGITYANPIQWSILTDYPAYTIVMDNGYNAYMSLQDVPSGTPLTDANYWLQIGDFYAYVPQIVEDEGIYEQERVLDHFLYYIDGSAGSDDNNGLTAGTAFKTIDRFMQESRKSSQIRCRIIRAGTYTMTSGNTIDNMTIQIKATVSGVTLNLHPDGGNDFNFYGGYLRLDGVDASHKMTVICPPSTGNVYGSISSVNSLFRFEFVSIPYNLISCNGGNVQLETCDFMQLYLHDGNGHIVSPSVTNTDPTAHPIHLLNAKMALTGTWTVAEPSMNTSVSFMLARYSDLTVQSVILPANMTNKYLYGIEGVGCYVNITSARQAAIAANAASGNVLDANPNMNNVFNPF